MDLLFVQEYCNVRMEITKIHIDEDACVVTSDLEIALLHKSRHARTK